MLTLNDFFHLAEVDTLMAQMTAGGPGLTIVAGLDPRPVLPLVDTNSLLASGRGSILRILMREVMDSRPYARGLVVAEDRDAVRVPRQLSRRVEVLPVAPPYTYASRIAEAVHRRPELLVIDQLNSENVPAALEAARQGQWVLSQMDTVFQGLSVVRQLMDLGAARDMLGGLAWILAVQRLPALCPRCKQPVTLTPDQRRLLRDRFPDLGDSAPEGENGFFRAVGCEHCQGTGRYGTVMVFDFFQAGADPLQQPSVLPMREYALHLGRLGHLALEDVIDFEADQVRRMYNLLVTSERALADSNSALQRKLAELETANHVLQQKSEALISLQDIGQLLITSSDLDDLADRVCRRARDLCGADRAILYWLHEDGGADILAVSGWDAELIHLAVDPELICDIAGGTQPVPFNRWPPGLTSHGPDVDGFVLRAGLSVPLLAQDTCVGVMLVHSTVKSRFAPGETALFHTFANHAAMAIQRAGLVQQLRAKIELLEAAQTELAKKERIERELELARQVQQSVLPRTFPDVPGYQFAALNEPARQVGGDFYDVIWLDDDRFGIAIADVSDKGMPAALYMALTRSLLLAEARRERSPRDVIANVNGLLLELGEPNMFVTLFYGVVDRLSRRLTYTRAGHDYPLLVRDGSARELRGKGVALGLLGDLLPHLSEEEVILNPGDRVVLYTDGLTDIMSPDGQFYEYTRLESLVLDRAGLPAGELCRTVFETLASYRADAQQFDDMTMLVLAVQ